MLDGAEDGLEYGRFDEVPQNGLLDGNELCSPAGVSADGLVDGSLDGEWREIGVKNENQWALPQPVRRTSTVVLK